MRLASVAQAGLPLPTTETHVLAQASAFGDTSRTRRLSIPVGGTTGEGDSRERPAGLVRLDSHPENAVTETPPKPSLGSGASGRRDGGERPAPTDVAIYELTGPWSTYRWLCAADVSLREAQGWTARKRQDAPRVDSCDDCELRRQTVSGAKT